MRNMFRLGLISLALAAAPFVAHAQATRTWVSGVGDDVNPCSRTAPCKTFAGAISKTAAGGEINTLDPGGFGTVTITKSITIGTDPIYGGILSSSTTGIVINAAATDVINLRGLVINGGIGTSTGLNGVRILQAGTVNITNSKISGNRTAGNGNGIYVINSSGTLKLNVVNSTLSENGTGSDGAGLFIQPSGTGSVVATVDSTAMINNVRGIRGDSTLTSGSINVFVKDSTFNNNAMSGLSVISGASSPAVMYVTGSSASQNASGINSNGAVAEVRLSDSVVTGNTNGFLPSNSGKIISYGNNVIDGNTGSNNPTQTVVLR